MKKYIWKDTKITNTFLSKIILHNFKNGNYVVISSFRSLQNVMIDPTTIMTYEQNDDLNVDLSDKAVSGEQKSFANKWKKRTEQKSSQSSDVNDDTDTTPKVVSVHSVEQKSFSK